FLKLCDLLYFPVFSANTRNTPGAGARPRNKKPGAASRPGVSRSFGEYAFLEDSRYRSQQGNGFLDAGRKRSICERLLLLRFDTRELHHLSPFLGFLGDELGEVGRRAGRYLTAEFRHSRRHHRLGERRVDLPIEPLDDLARGALGNANAEEA